MDTPNVNNLNGIPNFGHGFEEEIPTEAPIDEEDMETETEVNEDKPTRKRKAQDTQIKG